MVRLSRFFLFSYVSRVMVRSAWFLSAWYEDTLYIHDMHIRSVHTCCEGILEK